MNTKNLRDYETVTFLKRLSRVKGKDKILFGITAVFLLIVFCFIGFARIIFEGLEKISKATQPIIEKSSSNIMPLSEFKEIREQFEHLDEVIEKNKRLSNEELQQAVGQFHQNYKRAQENFHHNDLSKKNHQKEPHP